MDFITRGRCTSCARQPDAGRRCPIWRYPFGEAGILDSAEPVQKTGIEAGAAAMTDSDKNGIHRKWIKRGSSGRHPTHAAQLRSPRTVLARLPSTTSYTNYKGLMPDG